MPDGMRQLRPPSGVEKREQVELPGVVRPMAATAESRDAKDVSASAQRTRYEVGGVHSAIVAAYDARAAGDGGPLGVGGRHRWCSLKRRSAPQGLTGAQAYAPAKRGSLHRFLPFKMDRSQAPVVAAPILEPSGACGPRFMYHTADLGLRP